MVSTESYFKNLRQMPRLCLVWELPPLFSKFLHSLEISGQRNIPHQDVHIDLLH